MEIKGGPSGRTDPDLEHDYGTTSYYRWQFRLPSDFVGANTFCHLFQLKAQGGPDVSYPTLTLTARADRVELKHDAGDENPGGDQGSVDSSSLVNFKGKWVEVAMEILHENIGTISMTVNDVATGNLLMSYANPNIDLFRGNSGEGVINRPKWGIYRSLNETVSPALKDEIIRFANFCSSETSANLCPSLLPTAGTPDVVTNALPVGGANFVPLSMPIVWSASNGASSYNVYFGTSPTPPLVQNISTTSYFPLVTGGETYYYQIGAVGGAQESLNSVQSFTTLATSDGDWEVARGHARPNVEASSFFEFYTFASGVAEIDETTAIAGEPGNIQHTFFSTESTTGNHYWRYRPEAGEQLTVVARLKPIPGNSNTIYFDFRSLGYRVKVRINRSNLRFEHADDAEDSEPFNGFWDDEEFHTIRLTFANNPGSQQAGIIAKVYLDENTTPFATRTSTTTNGSRLLNIGRSGGDNYGASIDFVAINPTGIFPPMTPSAELPADLLAPVFLPVQWTSPLTVQSAGKNQALTWGVANQDNTDQFVVESRSGGADFTAIGRLAADGQFAGERQFKYVDERPLVTTTYYRIRQVDFDGQFSFSNVVSVIPTSGEPVQLSPNPTNGNIWLHNLPEEATSFRVVSVMGREVYSGTLPAGSHELLLGKFPPGTYLLRLNQKNRAPQTLRFVRQ
jgi:hypothetical protein